MKDSEFLAEIKAREELEQRGYKRIPCKECGGAGYQAAQYSGTPRLHFFDCIPCEGKGFTWKKP